MMYQLTLTHEERKAIDWIGDRYAHGDELYKLLWGGIPHNREDLDWDDPDDITFYVPEHIAWEIEGICDESLDCFSPELVEKLRKFCDKII